MNEHLISAGRVFASTFIVTVAGAIASAGTITWTKDFWFSIAVAGVSAAFKMGINAYLTDTTKVV